MNNKQRKAQYGMKDWGLDTLTIVTLAVVDGELQRVRVTTTKNIKGQDNLSSSKAERAEIAEKVLDWSRSADPEKEACKKAERRQRRKEEKRARREQEAVAEVERQEERDQRDAAQDVEMAEAREELERLRGLLSIASGSGSGPIKRVERPRKRKRKAAAKETTLGLSRPWTESADGWNGGEGEVNTEVDSPVEQEKRCDRCIQRRLRPCIIEFGRTACKACSRVKAKCSAVPPDDKRTRKRARKDSDAESSVNTPVTRKTRKTAKSPVRRHIVKRRTVESEVEEVPPEVAEAGPRTRIDDLQRFDRRYDDLMSRLRNFYRRSDMLLSPVRRAEDGAEITLQEIFECQSDIAERWMPVAKGLRETWEMEEAEAAMGDEAEGSGDSESRNSGEEDEPGQSGVSPDGHGGSPMWPEGFELSHDGGAKTPEGSGSTGSDGEKDAEGEKDEERPKSRSGARETSAPPIVTEPLWETQGNTGYKLNCVNRAVVSIAVIRALGPWAYTGADRATEEPIME
ncbi:hypothetical protein FB451DRAFT_1172000 [Mycena latifolia]|nr:hypothetical protein FB451DRAFT_1172000 [Mycena latifolia]